jgi:peptidoglycan/xylan/chitin deacetylase (PgdA/CDA1 family)
MSETNVRVSLPDGVRCAVALSYDLEMCAGYQPDGVNHGRILPEVQKYALDLCGVAEEFGTQLHFFHVGNGFDETFDCLEEMLHRGHFVDNHTFTHLPLLTDEVERLDEELAKVNALYEERLGWGSTVLRGPGGYQDGLDDRPENQEVILKNGFKWVSCRFDSTDLKNREYVLASPAENVPYAYPSGLVEIPIHGYTDRSFFDNIFCVDRTAYNSWRSESGGTAVVEDWSAPWTSNGALDEWLVYNRQAIDYAYENRLLWVPTWHPTTHYYHDRENIGLRDLLSYAQSKDEKVWVCTVRDAANMISLNGDHI